MSNQMTFIGMIFLWIDVLLVSSTQKEDMYSSYLREKKSQCLDYILLRLTPKCYKELEIAVYEGHYPSHSCEIEIDNVVDSLPPHMLAYLPSLLETRYLFPITFVTVIGLVVVVLIARWLYMRYYKNNSPSKIKIKKGLSK